MSEKDVPLLNFTELVPSPQLFLQSILPTPFFLQFPHIFVCSLNMRHIYRQLSNLLTPDCQVLPICNSGLDSTTGISKECPCGILDSVLEEDVIAVVGMLTGGNGDIRPEQAEVGTK
jgi:hypothetical protein